MRTATMFSLALAVSAVMPAAARAGFEEDRQLVLYVCSRCHAINEYYLADRDLKAWQLTIKRMQDQTYVDEGFSDAQAERIAEFLAEHPFDLDVYRPRPEPASLPASRPVPARVAPSPKSTPKANSLAKHLGYLAVVALVLLLASGLARRAIGKNFRSVHGILAFIFCGSLTVHAAVFLAEYGVPGVFWYWCGIIAAAGLLVSEAIALARPRNLRTFLWIHIPPAVAGAVLTAMHWVWIYI